MRLLLLFLVVLLSTTQSFAMFKLKPGMQPFPWYYGGGPTGNPMTDYQIWYGQETRRLEEEQRQAAREAAQRKAIQDEENRKVQAGVDLGNLYTNFSTISAHNLTETEDFIENTTFIITKYPQYFPTSKQHFTTEKRIAFKIIYAIVIYIANSDVDAHTHLVSAGFTPAEIASLTINRQQSKVASIASFGGGGGSNVPLSTILANHVTF